MLTYFDEQGLFGSLPHPSSHWSGGNQLLETVTALVIAKALGQLQPSDVAKLITTIRSCEAGAQGIYDKNPPWNGQRRRDEITHDDMLAVSCGSKILGLPFAGEIRNFGSTHRLLGNWVLSNTGNTYPEAVVRPFHKGIYLANAGERIDNVSLKALRVFMTMAPDDASGKRLMWLITQAVEGVDPKVQDSIAKWRATIKASGGMKEVFRQFHGPTHVFTRFFTMDY
jgi:hypothetical protein